MISRKGAPNIKGLGKLRYVVEQAFSLLHHFKRLGQHTSAGLDSTTSARRTGSTASPSEYWHQVRVEQIAHVIPQQISHPAMRPGSPTQLIPVSLDQRHKGTPTDMPRPSDGMDAPDEGGHGSGDGEGAGGR
ncbi:mobile element protein [Streptomyces sp. NL15-2K]|nr:mobile element protein [Streptomyces sp. NL15-2K]